MAYGSATHLWILGTPTPSEVKEWLSTVAPDVHSGDVDAWQLGDRLLLGAVNTSEHEWRSRSIGVVSSLSSTIKGFDWVSIDIQPELDSWRIENSAGALLERSEQPDNESQLSLEMLEQAKKLVRELVPLKLEELHHYVDWAHELEDLGTGQPAPELGVPVHRIELGLRPAPPPPAVAEAAQTTAAGVLDHWLSIACIVATAFTVSMVQAPGPSAFASRLNHFLIQAASMWLLGTLLTGVTANGWPGVRPTLVSAGAIFTAGIIWSIMPF